MEIFLRQTTKGKALFFLYLRLDFRLSNVCQWLGLTTKSLGVGTLWLFPFFSIPPSDYLSWRLDIKRKIPQYLAGVWGCLIYYILYINFSLNTTSRRSHLFNRKKISNKFSTATIFPLQRNNMSRTLKSTINAEIYMKH